ncbi:MAG: hypothetical protein ABIO39_00420 [Caulobacteraceae bacterium]
MLRNLALIGVAGAMLAACSHDDAPARFQKDSGLSYGFFFSDEGATAKLAYGQANSDNVGMMLECVKGSRRVDITDAVRSVPSPTLTLASGRAHADLKTKVADGEGGSVLTTSARSDNAVLRSFRRSGAMEVAYSGLRYRMVASPKERDSVERFFGACDART